MRSPVSQETGKARITDGAWRAAYAGLVVPAARALLPAAGLLDRKLAAFREARKNWQGALAEALARRPDIAAGDALWVHAASAGEFLQARVLLAALRSARPAAPLVYTFTSPSAAPLLERFHGADLILPLPLDTPANARVWLGRVRPAALAVVDAELWPSFLQESVRGGVRVALVSARLAADAGRLRFPARGFYRHLYRSFHVVCSVDAASAERLRAAGVTPARLRVTGDLRVDETLRRAAGVSPDRPLPLPRILPVVVAGSTWPDDEAVLLPSLETLRDRGTFFSLVVAPHEVHERRLLGLEDSLAGAGFTAVRWSRAMPSDEEPRSRRLLAADAVVVDRIGLLHRLYVHAAVAFVGGGFHGKLHNVMEPAAFGAPVVTGPQTERAWIAGEMLTACGLFPVADPAACVAVLEHLLTDGAAARTAGERARRVLAGHAGACERTLAALSETGWLPQEEAGAGTSGRN